MITLLDLSTASQIAFLLPYLEILSGTAEQIPT